jgi:hypothetical protein
MRFALILLMMTGLLRNAIAQQKKYITNVLVIGASTGGTAAALQAARMRVNTLVVEPTPWLGGMLTAAGVSATDGNNLLPSGIWQEFRQAMYQHYGKSNLASGWVSNFLFEPHVGDSIFKAWAAKEKTLTVLHGWFVDKLLIQKNKVTGAEFVNKQGERMVVEAKITIDATDLGDGFASAKIPFDLGTEDPANTGERSAPGKTNIVQDLTWATTLKDYGDNTDRSIDRPNNYDSTQFFCCCTDAPCKEKPWNGDKMKMLNYGLLPNKKYMINWPAHGNDYYLSVFHQKPIEREALYQKAKDHTLGFVYFLQTQLGLKHISLCDEFGTDDKLAWMPYHREGRRVQGLARLNINHIAKPYDYELYRTGISVGDYPVDHHHAKNEAAPKINFPAIPSYNIPLGALIPQKMEGLIVADKGISVSNIANGTTRLQPVVLLTGQAAGLLAAYCVIEKKQPAKISIRHLQYALLQKKCWLMPFVDVPMDSVYWESIQIIGLTGILRGTGKNEGWANRTYFYPDSTVTTNEFLKGLAAVNPNMQRTMVGEKDRLTIGSAIDIINQEMHSILRKPRDTAQHSYINATDLSALWSSRFGLNNFDAQRPILRKELAVITDKIYAPFFKTIDHQGKMK